MKRFSGKKNKCPLTIWFTMCIRCRFSIVLITNYDFSGDHSELYSTLTQQEHPILHKPFYTVHPCRTHELLVFNNPNFNPIVAILSIVGPKINLPIKIDYAVR